MSKPLRFHGEALEELTAGAVYYEAKSSGLGARFASEVEAATHIAAEFPEMGAPFKHGTRRVFPKKFPFSVVYRIQADEIVVLAVAPDVRKPGYWRERKNNG
ncbi:MAG: type II toxin-antitoxin system RelE/ParE family toxin [Rhodoferax sp.]|uniref:type II toxin-antitoxin system RelE/ParE family toxin n=1 Tax=Rhodoferax sp. TaxID=50421 RepID=UPI003C73F896